MKITMCSIWQYRFSTGIPKMEKFEEYDSTWGHWKSQLRVGEPFSTWLRVFFSVHCLLLAVQRKECFENSVFLYLSVSSLPQSEEWLENKRLPETLPSFIHSETSTIIQTSFHPRLKETQQIYFPVPLLHLTLTLSVSRESQISSFLWKLQPLHNQWTVNDKNGTSRDENRKIFRPAQSSRDAESV